jgi:hypothetical protein
MMNGYLRIGASVAEGGEQNPESHKDTRENTRDTISNKLFHKVLLRICVSVRDLTKSQPYVYSLKEITTFFLTPRTKNTKHSFIECPRSIG